MEKVPAKVSLYEYELHQWQSIFHLAKYSPQYGTRLFRHLYKQAPQDFHQDMQQFLATLPQNLGHALPNALKDIITENFSLGLPQVVKLQQSQDETWKLLLQMEDGHRIETVLIPFQNRYTVCLSTQVGCAMKYQFCYTGTQGLSRNLTAAEIVGQYLVAWKTLVSFRSCHLQTPNVVFMGQGEPLHNFEAVKKAISILLHPQGPHSGPRQITLSTAGYLPGLRRFGEMGGINLALSLHSAMNHKRSQLIPLNRSYPIEEVVEVLTKLPLKKRQYINLEVLLIHETTDGPEDLMALKGLLNGPLKGTPTIINLIPYNPFPHSALKRPTEERVYDFQRALEQAGFFATVRTTKGHDILAACGQLKV